MSDTFGYGQQNPDDSASDYNSYSFMVNQILNRVRTMVLVEVMAVTNAGELSPVGFVDAKPLVNQVDGQGNSTPHGTIFNLPYFRLQGGKNAIIIDPEVGDIGLAIIADRDISAVKSTKAAANPGSSGRFDLADGVYLGGILNGIPEQYARFSSDGIKVADKNGNVVEMKSGSVAITGNVAVTGNITATGSITAGQGGGDQIGLQTHVHPGNNTPPTAGS